MTDRKYVVFKAEDWDEVIAKDPDLSGLYQTMLKKIERYAIDDAVVIRRQDAFASAALHTYANSMMISAKTIGELAPSTRDRLLSIADYFHEQAVLSDDSTHKLPD